MPGAVDDLREAGAWVRLVTVLCSSRALPCLWVWGGGREELLVLYEARLVRMRSGSYSKVSGSARMLLWTGLLLGISGEGGAISVNQGAVGSMHHRSARAPC